MKKSLFFVLAVVLIIVGLTYTITPAKITAGDTYKSYKNHTSGAGESMDMWFFERAYPTANLNMRSFNAAFFEKKEQSQNSSRALMSGWESLGPQNIGGRTLCLAFHPSNPDIIFAGSASAGLWKTTTRGVGENAWQHIPTNFPVLGVASIAIDPNDPDIIFIGTGETYGVGFAEPGEVNRFTRGSYGIGILKTTDGGATWNHILPFEQDEIIGVQDMVINPQNSNEVYAATTNGLYQSLNGGANWSIILNELNVIDIELHPTNDNIIYVTNGNFNTSYDPQLNGIYKSTNKGASFTKLTDAGLISAWSGNAKIALDPNNPEIIYASIQELYNVDPTTPGGVFKSTNGGNTWAHINNQNIALYQGWYSHDIAINPSSSNEIINVGIDTWKSTNGGVNFSKVSNWQAWEFGEIPVGTPEGSDEYVHGDIHGVYYHPLLTNTIFLATDGGVFSSDTNGASFETHNGGLQTTQFYPNMGNSTTNPDYCIAGAQDNATYIYKGNLSWWRVIGGDGMSAAVNPDDDQIVFGSYQNLGIRRSTNGGDTFVNAMPTLVGGDYTAFLAPYAIAPSNSDIMYAGASYLYRSTNTGVNYLVRSNGPVDNGNVIVTIEINPFDENEIYIATSPNPFDPVNPAKVMKSTDGGITFTSLSGLPNRICKDIVVDPTNPDIVYATFSGFGTAHVYKSLDRGTSWNAIDVGLPDVPTNTVFVDPLHPETVYIGNDLGVYYTQNEGANWNLYSNGLPDATMVVHLSYSPSNRKLRIATHGRGIYQSDLVNDLGIPIENDFISSFKIYPNPTEEIFAIQFNLKEPTNQFEIKLYSIQGKAVVDVFSGALQNGLHTITSNVVGKLPSGIYFVSVLNKKNVQSTQRLIVK